VAGKPSPPKVLGTAQARLIHLHRFHTARAEELLEPFGLLRRSGSATAPAGRNPLPQSAAGVAQKEELTMDNQDVIATLNDLIEISRMENVASARVPKASRPLISRRCSSQRRGVAPEARQNLKPRFVV
jgi:hypothetical protein